MAKSDFPWHIGVFDAHCHPTDTMASIRTIPDMKARCLTVMATRAQDQELVAQTAEQYGVRSPDVGSWSQEKRVVPCFGWHPWFAHMMWIDDEYSDADDMAPEDRNTSRNPTASKQDDSGDPKNLSTGHETAISSTPPTKESHYTSILRPTPQESHAPILTSLPSPQPFSAFLAQTRAHLSTHPFALVGEIGLDRSFRIPDPSSSPKHGEEEGLTPGGREGRRLTPFRCAPDHQKRIFKRQLQLAADMGRGVSVHGVQAHGLVFEVLQELWRGHEKAAAPSKRARKKMKEEQPPNETNNEAAKQQHEPPQTNPTPYPPRICLHSYSGTAAHLQAHYLSPTIPAELFFSFSHAINLSSLPLPSSSSSHDSRDFSDTPQPFIDVVRAVPDHMLLVESDLHTAGDAMDARLEEIVRRVCWVKGWELDEGTRVLARNWGRWVFGDGRGREDVRD